MKQKHPKSSNLQTISKRSLSSLKGGHKEEEGYKIVYINGKPHKIKVGKDGKPTSLPEEIF